MLGARISLGFNDFERTIYTEVESEVRLCIVRESELPGGIWSVLGRKSPFLDLDLLACIQPRGLVDAELR